MAPKSKKGLRRTPLHDAAIDGNEQEIRKLLRAGAEPSSRDESGWTPLHFAAQEHATGAVRALLEAGAEVDAMDEHGNTPLLRATFVSCGRGDVIQLLRQAGADAWRANASGVSPASLARTIANYPVAQHFADLPPSGPAA
jgi:uncharacterized protein